MINQNETYKPPMVEIRLGEDENNYTTFFYLVLHPRRANNQKDKFLEIINFFKDLGCEVKYIYVDCFSIKNFSHLGTIKKVIDVTKEILREKGFAVGQAWW